MARRVMTREDCQLGPREIADWFSRVLKHKWPELSRELDEGLFQDELTAMLRCQ